MFKNILNPLALLPNGWRHVGYVCFPRIMSKDELSQDKISEQDLQRILKVKFLNFKYVSMLCIKIMYIQKVLTRAEMEDPDCSWLSEALSNKNNSPSNNGKYSTGRDDILSSSTLQILWITRG